MKHGTEVKIEEQCITCNKKFKWHEVFIAKMPEGTTFCLGCSEKYKDDNKYELPDCWVTNEYEKGLTYVWDKNLT